MENYQRPRLMCPACHSANVAVQVVNEIDLKPKHKGVLWWVLIGWLWVPLKWIFFFFPALIIKIFRPKRYKTANRAKTYFACQNCGHTWTR